MFSRKLRTTMEPISCPQTSVRNYHSTLREIPKELRSNLHGGGILKSPTLHLFVTSSKTRSFLISLVVSELGDGNRNMAGNSLPIGRPFQALCENNDLELVYISLRRGRNMDS